MTAKIVQCGNHIQAVGRVIPSILGVATRTGKLRNISDTIARLAALKALPRNTPSGSRGKHDRLGAVPAFGSNPGTLNARCYVPDRLSKGSPLVVVLHGCTQNAAGYDYCSGWSRLADEGGFALLYPEQQRGNNPNLCFNWFLPRDTERHVGEAMSIRQMIETVVLAHNIDRDRIFITGLSAGGAMAASMLAIYPEVFAGGAIIAGLAHGIAGTIPEAFDRMRGHGLPSEHDLQRKLRAASDHNGPWPKISIWHGTSDQTVQSSNAQKLAAQWRAVHSLDRAPTYSKKAGVVSKEVWCNPFGEALVEINRIAGMGHGTPLASDLGNPGPFMLDVGVSSTREIADFWGIADVDRDQTDSRLTYRTQKPRPAPSQVAKRQIDPTLVEPPTSDRPQQKISGVQKTIEDALRSAGLMR